MRILLIASAYNSMTQRVHAELADRERDVSVELALGDEVMRDAVRRFDPDLVIAPMLTTAIPADIWSAVPCLIVHPGPRGDRGPSSLDWAIMEGAARWGVTVTVASAVPAGRPPDRLAGRSHRRGAGQAPRGRHTGQRHQHRETGAVARVPSETTAWCVGKGSPRLGGHAFRFLNTVIGC